MNSKRKGTRFEQLVVKLCKAAGFEAVRVPLSGAVPGFRGDVLLQLTPTFILNCEAKAVHRESQRVKTLWEKYGSINHNETIWISDPGLALTKLSWFLHFVGKQLIVPARSISCPTSLSLGKIFAQWMQFSDCLIIKELKSQKDAFIVLPGSTLNKVNVLCN